MIPLSVSEISALGGFCDEQQEWGILVVGFTRNSVSEFCNHVAGQESESEGRFSESGKKGEGDLPPVDLLVEDGVPHDGPACEDDQHRDEKADQTLPTNPKLLINCWVEELIKN